MGVYIDPPTSSKEEWLAINGKKMTAPIIPADNSQLPVCLVDNGPFTAAAICYSEREVEAFSRPADPRPRVWFMVDIDKLQEIAPDLARYLV